MLSIYKYHKILYFKDVKKLNKKMFNIEKINKTIEVPTILPLKKIVKRKTKKIIALGIFK